MPHSQSEPSFSKLHLRALVALLTITTGACERAAIVDAPICEQFGVDETMLYGTFWTEVFIEAEPEGGERPEAVSASVLTLLDPICVRGHSEDASDAIEIDYLKQIELVSLDPVVEFPDQVTGAAWGKLVRAEPSKHRFKARFVVDRYIAAE